jgi:hypothetical protein
MWKSSLTHISNPNSSSYHTTLSLSLSNTLPCYTLDPQAPSSGLLIGASLFLVPKPVRPVSLARRSTPPLPITPIRSWRRIPVKQTSNSTATRVKEVSTVKLAHEPRMRWRKISWEGQSVRYHEDNDGARKKTLGGASFNTKMNEKKRELMVQIATYSRTTIAQIIEKKLESHKL